jgi:hypothetical protein
MKQLLVSLGLCCALLTGSIEAQQINWEQFDPKTASEQEMERVRRFLEDQIRRTSGSPAEIKSLIMRGNKITTIVYNYGNITRPNTLCQIADLVWNRLGYGFEFTPLVSGHVADINNNEVRILNDGMWLPGQGGYAPDGTLKWGWLPKPGYAATGQPDIAAWSHRADVAGDLTRKPHSWPEAWYNDALGRYVWPAFLGDDATSPDEEVYFVTDDHTNMKYQYYPFPDDSSKRGLGLDMEVRFFQFNNPLAEDIIFLVYRITNQSPKTIPTVYFGMYGDPHVGGCADFNDDLAFFIPPSGPIADPFPQRARSMVYAWDPDGIGQGGLPTGYFGFKFLESPSNSFDNIDNDDDGIIDESPFNEAGVFIDGVGTPLTTGIADVAKYTQVYGAPRPRWSGDENGNWDPERDDVGLDGLPGTGDFGEGNGRPDIGFDAFGNLTAEPNFGIRDVNESDQIGLTSFWALPYTNSLPNVPKNDILFTELMSADSFAIDQALFSTPADNIFLYSSGPFPLGPQGTQRFSVALLMGHDLQDLILNAEVSQRVLEANYRFAAPPPKPNVSAVPGDRRVTLYWDNIAEDALDPLTRLKDFEGYKIYRSEDPTFADVFTITDANGNPFLGKAFTQNGFPAQFDLVNEWSGLHPIEYQGRGVRYNLGNNTGLVHEYVDSSVTNGKTYYYAVVSYDHGSATEGAEFPPSESQAVIKQDPITREITFDVNTVAVTPGPIASGYIRASVGDGNLATQVRGVSSGPVRISILDDLMVPDNVTYHVDFDTVANSMRYSVYPLVVVSDRFISRDTLSVPLSKKNLLPDSIEVRDANGALVDPSRYFVNTERGVIRGAFPGALQANAQFEARYRYFTVFESDRLKGEDDNAAFDGMRVYVVNEPLGIDSTRSGWLMVNNTNLTFRVGRPLTALTTQPFDPIPADFEIRWNSTDTTANGKWAAPGDTALNNLGQRVVVCPFRIVNVTNDAQFRIFVNGAAADSMWRPGREIILLTPSGAIRTYYAVTFAAATTGEVRLPTAGNVFVAKTTKPFRPADRYMFTTTAVRFDEATAKSALDRIYVVPNPYVAYSSLERPGISATLRGDQALQFRNLPPKCTIRIYTMVGELVETLVKDDDRSFIEWNIISNEGQRLAYGVYIYHVDIPGVGEKIGRLALIK